MPPPLDPDEPQRDALGRHDEGGVRAEVAWGRVSAARVVHHHRAPAAAAAGERSARIDGDVARGADGVGAQIAAHPVVRAADAALRRQRLAPQLAVGGGGVAPLDADAARVADGAAARRDVARAHAAVRRHCERVRRHPVVALADVARRQLVAPATHAAPEARRGVHDADADAHCRHVQPRQPLAAATDVSDILKK